MPILLKSTARDSSTCLSFNTKPAGCIVAFRNQLFYSTPKPGYFLFFRGKELSGKCRAVSELKLALAA